MAGDITTYQTKANLADDSSNVTGTDVSGNKRALDVQIANADLSGSFTPSGLQNGGLITVVTINKTGWTALPATALTDRNQINIQNFSGSEIKVNFDNTEPGYVGMRVPTNTERFYQITDSINVYAKLDPSSGDTTVDIEVEEIS